MTRPQDIRLSILDQALISEGESAGQALAHSVELAQLADRLNYERMWIAEHHGSDTVATSAPEVIIPLLAQATKRMRVGSGAVLLSHYSPFKVAEQFRTLEVMFPGRIDLGVARSLGAQVLESFALRRERDTKQPPPNDFTEQLRLLLAMLHGQFPNGHPFRQLTLRPESIEQPHVWLLGSSASSGQAAGQLGLRYAAAQFISGKDAQAAVRAYRSAFRPAPELPRSHAILAVTAVCAPTDEEARYLASSHAAVLEVSDRGGGKILTPAPTDVLTPFMRELFSSGRLIAGSPETLRAQLASTARDVGADEVMVLTVCHDHAARLRSYELLASAFSCATIARSAAPTQAARS